MSPSDLKLVYVDIDDATRYSRIRAEGLLDSRRLARIDAHSTEEQVGTTLKQIADLNIEGSRPQDEIISVLMAWIGTWEEEQRSGT